MRQSLALAPALFVLTLAVSSNAGAATYIVGTGVGCTHSSLQAAINAAASNPEPDVVRVTRSLVYSGVAVTIQNQDLLLQGQWPACNSVVRDATLTPLSGNNVTSVLTISGSGGVSIIGFQVSNGNTSSSGKGGAVRIEQVASGSVYLQDVRLDNNNAASGGAVSVVTAATDPQAGSQLQLGQNVRILSNHARIDGGALHCAGARVRASEPGIEFNFNSADRDGGAIAATHCDLELSSGGGALASMFFGNAAVSHGGAVFLLNSTATAYTRDALAPIRFRNNSAERGGALALIDRSSFTGFETRFDGNRAYITGGAIYQYNGVSLATNRLTLRRSGGSGDGVRCTLEVCGSITENVARRSDESVGAGAVLRAFSVAAGGTVESIFAGQRISDNSGVAVFRGNEITTTEGTTRFILENSLVHHNDTAGQGIIYSASGSDHAVINSTISDHSLAGNSTFSMGGNPTHPNRLKIRNSLIAEGDQSELVYLTNPPMLDVSFLRTEDSRGMEGNATVYLGAPGFRDAPARNYELGASSLARDVASVEIGQFSGSLDLSGQTRTVDLAGVTNGPGAQDLGAFESPSVLPAMVFANGFE